ncbi:hypothetical protein vBPaerPsIn_194c [Pseudomonas phage vB_Paer_PsIn]|uniref:Uncharacterized protein n=1 Tax=Pseudomonas phage vB_Paer_PsIn TaxID=2924907 RepID=A0AAE9GSD2_9CAUD|nr:hypothetical protein QE348_gp195 [Pseudomonas phage vB_Paer_PsIn]UOL48222.1 hypothetical protein vBPaerPsIn_194c [Pseudomonas phage vB_Paer_PsIn]
MNPQSSRRQFLRLMCIPIPPQGQNLAASKGVEPSPFITVA